MNIEVFHSSDNSKIEEYLRLKKLIFVEEYGWPLKTHNSTETKVSLDTYDTCSLFFGAYKKDRMIGVCRCSFPLIDYPYKDILDSHIHNSNASISEHAILTSYAFLKEYRGLPDHENKYLTKHTLAYELFLFIVAHLRTKGIRRILLSAGTNGSEKAFSKWGFKAVSGEIHLEGAPTSIRNYAYDIL